MIRKKPRRITKPPVSGSPVDLTLEHLETTRDATLLFYLTKRLIETKWRDRDQEPKWYLFGQLKRIAKQWLAAYLVCKGGTSPAQLRYQALADMACSRITVAITQAEQDNNRPLKAILDPYNSEGSTKHVNFNTSQTHRWKTDSRKSHLNWVILDSTWEGEFCRVVEAHERVHSYVKNHSLGFEVPYLYGSETRKYRPDFIVQIDDGKDDLLNLVVEIKGYRREDAKDKKLTMETYWIPGVNNLGHFGRWAFVEFTDVFDMQQDFAKKIEAEFNKMLAPLIL